MSTPVLYAQDILTLTQLKSTLKNVKRFSKLGFYVEVEETVAGKYRTYLYGPTIYWRRKSVWEIINADKDRISS